jgi:acyl-CoA thioesterase 8
VHGIWDFVKPPLTEFHVDGEDLSEKSAIHHRIPASDEEPTERRHGQPRRVSMMVTINHTMYFHAPTKIKADEWMLMELSSHWSGSGRGIATQKIWTKEGILIATCLQEGIVRFTPSSRGSQL